jgi:hypothetical protein
MIAEAIDECAMPEELFEYLTARACLLSGKGSSKREALMLQFLIAANRDLLATCKVIAAFCVEAFGRRHVGGGAAELERIMAKVRALNAQAFAEEIEMWSVGRRP